MGTLGPQLYVEREDLRLSFIWSLQSLNTFGEVDCRLLQLAVLKPMRR